MFSLRLFGDGDAAVPDDPSVPWLRGARRDFSEKLLGQDPPYPCHFGAQGQQTRKNWYTAFDGEAQGVRALPDLADTLREFRRRAWSGPKQQSLIVFVGPPDEEPDLERDTARFWDLLGRLTALDTELWPAECPRDVTDPEWEWCFDGEPWFVFAGSPGYRNRRSRNLAPCLVVTFQVLRVFEGIGGSSPAGKSSRNRVRTLLADYDLAPLHPHLADPKIAKTFRWRQYVLPDDQRVLPEGGCPFTGRHPGGIPAAGPGSA